MLLTVMSCFLLYTTTIKLCKYVTTLTVEILSHCDRVHVRLSTCSLSYICIYENLYTPHRELLRSEFTYLLTYLLTNGSREIQQICRKKQS